MKKHEAAFLAFTLLFFAALIVYMAERISRLREQVHNFSNPAQLQIHDTQDQKMFPITSSIKCRVLPCTRFTGSKRQCVVSCDVIRRPR